MDAPRFGEDIPLLALHVEPDIQRHARPPRARRPAQRAAHVNLSKTAVVFMTASFFVMGMAAVFFVFFSRYEYMYEGEQLGLFEITLLVGAGLMFLTGCALMHALHWCDTCSRCCDTCSRCCIAYVA